MLRNGGPACPRLLGPHRGRHRCSYWRPFKKRQMNPDLAIAVTYKNVEMRNHRWMGVRVAADECSTGWTDTALIHEPYQSGAEGVIV